MKRQRCRFSLSKLILWSAALLVAEAVLPARAAAGNLQLFVDQAFVHHYERNSVVIGSCTVNAGPPTKFACPANSFRPGTAGSINGSFGNISNEPHIEFERLEDAQTCLAADPAAIPPGSTDRNFCNSDVFLCASIGYNNTEPGSTDVSLSEMSFELFKFVDGSNPLDPGSTPPLRTFFLDSPGFIPTNCRSGTPPFATPDCPGINGKPVGPLCVLWDGNVNIQGEQGKTNGTYGFRITAKTNVSGASGNITITVTRAYPSGATQEETHAPACTTVGTCFVSQKPISVDVTNIHVVRSSPTVVGSITGVAAQPYNMTYRISKDALVTLKVKETVTAALNVVRDVVPSLPRTGEGTPSGTLLNGDAWNGRHNNGDLVLPGVYLAEFNAVSTDQFGTDTAVPVTRQISIDPLAITDIRVQPLLAGSTSLAVLTYELTEPATVYIDIYSPGTSFTTLNGLNGALDDTGAGKPPKNFTPANGSLLRRIVEQKNSRTPVVSFWDGRDANGKVLDDGDYVFVIYAALPSENGNPFGGTGAKLIWTSLAKSGFLPIIRGFVGVTQISPGPSVIGSSPAVSGLNPFVFRYTLSREGLVNMRILDSSGNNVIKTLVLNQTRPGNFANSEYWDEPTNDAGQWISSGTYLIQLTAADPLLPSKISTVTASFPVDLFRLVDVLTTPLISGNSDFLSISYQPSQPMQVAWNIYPPGTQLLNTNSVWPPCGLLQPGGSCAQIVGPGGAPVGPVYTFNGFKAGRQRYTEFWDGRDSNGLFVQDGSYVFTLTAKSSTTPSYFASDRIFGSVTVSRGQIFFTNFNVAPDVPQLFNSSSTITLHPFTVSYSLSRESSVTVQILNTNVPASVIRTLFAGEVKQGGLLIQDVWDGRDDRGNFPSAGFYNVRAIAQDVASPLSASSTSQLTISYDPLRIYDVAVTPLSSEGGGAQLFYQVSETMKVAVKIFRPGTAFDASGTPSPPEATSLVKRIVGVRPARTEITEFWDGTDLRQSITPEGNYKFKIIGSTDITAIDTITGNVINASALSLDRPIDEIPVIRAGSADPQNDFENNTFAYPNPGNGPTITFSIWTPFQAKVRMNIYTIAGEMILDKDFGEWPAESYVNGQAGFVWNKTNQSGRKVGRGMYLCVIRVEESIGGRNILQSVKRILIP
jgi:flagellar hook assembly protein FlgD